MVASHSTSFLGDIPQKSKRRKQQIGKKKKRSYAVLNCSVISFDSSFTNFLPGRKGQGIHFTWDFGRRSSKTQCKPIDLRRIAS